MSELEQVQCLQPEQSQEEKPDRKKRFRDLINLILPDSLMLALAVVMLPVVLVPIFVNLNEAWDTCFNFLDYAILAIFILEYILKTIAAKSVWRHIINPWHLLDLFIIALPIISLTPAMASSRLSSSTPLLRLIRIARIIAVGSRVVDRKRQMGTAHKTETAVKPPIRMQVMDGDLNNVVRDVSIDKITEYIKNPAHTWMDISSISEKDFDKLSEMLGVPRILLESEMVDESYPRIDNFERYSMIFARIADVKISSSGPTRLTISRNGILVICQGQNILTLTKGQTSIFNQILEKTRKSYTPGEPIVVSILYALIKYILERDKQIIAALEQELMTLESIPTKDRPSNFLETTFYLRKEVNQLVPSLLHLKEVIDIITSKRVPLEGFNEQHARLFDILLDEAAYLNETASNARDNLLSLIDLYINTTSYEMNKVMRIIAVITSMSIIPAIGGLLGSNIAGNPWDIQLWQVFAVLGSIMAMMLWVFYRLGWLKG